MDENGFHKTKSIYFKVLAFITAIIIITVVVIAVITYSISARSIIANAEAYNQTLLTQRQTFIDKELGAIHSLAINILMTQSYMYSRRNTGLAVKSLIDLTRYLSEQRTFNRYIDSIYIYYDDIDMILSSDADIKVSNIASFYDTSWLPYLNDTNIPITIWLANRKPSNTNQNSAFSYSYNKYNKNFITLIKKLPLYGSTNGAIIINIDQDKLFSDYLGSYGDKIGVINIVDQHNTVIYTEAENSPYDIPSDISFETNLSNDKLIITYTISPLTKWKYINIIPKYYLLKNVNIIKRIVLWTALFYIAAAQILSYLISRRIYNPLQKVIAYIARWSSNPDKRMPGDEATFIKYTFDNIADENARLEMEKNNMERILNDNKGLLKEKYLNDLVSGNMRNAEKFQEYFDTFNIRIDFNGFAVIAIAIEDIHDILDTLDKIEFNLKKYGIVGTISPIIDGEIFLKDDDKIIILQNTKSEESLISLARSIKSILQSEDGLTVTIGISRIYSGLDNIERAYRDAENVLKSKIYYGKGEILAYKDIMIYNDTKQYYYPYELENKLVSYLKQGNSSEVEKIISCIIHEMSDKKIDNINIQQTFFQIIGEIMKFISQTGENMADIFGPNFNVNKEASRADTLQEMGNFLAQFCHRIIEYYNNKRTRINNDIIKRAKKFMETNYNNNISIDTVAEYVHMSTSHLNRIFKEMMGKTLNEYLIDVRINKAIELLSSTDLSVESICQYVGYSNVSYFNKVFKAKTGTTPGSFRRQFQDNAALNKTN